MGLIWEDVGEPQIRRAACSARRVKSHSMDMCLEPPCMEILGEGKRDQNQGPNPAKSALCWLFLALGRLFFALGHFLCTFWALLAHLGRFFRFFGRSGLDFAGSRAGFGASKTTFFDVFWCKPAQITEMFFMQQNHSFCDVL